MTAPVPDLTDTDRRRWADVALGRRTEEIAQRLVVSERTAKRMTGALFRKLGVENRLQAAVLAGKVGLLDGRLG